MVAKDDNAEKRKRVTGVNFAIKRIPPHTRWGLDKPEAIVPVFSTNLVKYEMVYALTYSLAQGLCTISRLVSN